MPLSLLFSDKPNHKQGSDAKFVTAAPSLLLQEPSQPMQNVIFVSNNPKSSTTETSNEVLNNRTSLPGNAEITAEQRARMEANRLKALERCAARASIPQYS
jgi:TIMELESS-interacting protein